MAACQRPLQGDDRKVRLVRTDRSEVGSRVVLLGILALVAVAVLVATFAAEGQQPGKVYRIGFMSTSSPQAAQRGVQIFLRTLKELSWVEGQNLLIEWRWAEGHLERLPALAAELVRLNVDLIVAVQPDAAVAAKKATTTIPIIFVLDPDPVARGLVASLARPGGNVTGLTISPGVDIVGKQLELLRETLPKASRVSVLRNVTRAAANAPALQEVERAARALGLTLQIQEVRGPEEFDRAFDAMARERVEALFVLGDPVFWFHRRLLADLEVKYRLPAMHNLRDYVEAGGLASYGVDLADLNRRSATYVEKILKGARPADLPVEQPTKFELVINRKTAKALGLTIPPSLLLRADRVIE
jgi:putative ABC transport system substrate-binding protein